MYCDAYHSTKQANDLRFSLDSEELPDRCFITVCTYFFVGNIDLHSKHPVKESHDNVRHQPLRHWFWHLFTQMCLRSHRRHSGNFLGPTCSVKGVLVFIHENNLNLLMRHLSNSSTVHPPPDQSHIKQAQWYLMVQQTCDALKCCL